MSKIELLRLRGMRILRKYKFDKRFLGRQKLTEQSFFNVDQGALICFSELCQSLSCNNMITEVNLSGCNINVYYAIELANLVQKNTNIEILQLASCKLNSFSLSCIFKAMIDHTGLAQLNLFNNQSFTPIVVQDFIKYVLKGKNPLIEINISHCNIENAQLSIILPTLKHLKSLKRFKMSLMNLNSESLLALSSAMLHYTGTRYLEYLDISSCQIKNHGIELLSKSLYLSVSQINLKSLNISANHITQDGVGHLEQLLLKLNLQEINLSRNKINEFQNQEVLGKFLIKVDLSNNIFEEIPNNFFLNVYCINLANNLINTQGAYQISQVLTNKKVNWTELNLNNNQIGTRGFISIVYALIENKSLTNLSVANNKINGEGILVYIFNHEQLILEYLDLSLNYLRYDLVYALISMMKECRLRTLVLCQLIQDENEIHSGKNELFEIKCANLKQLDFSGNPQIIMPILQSLAKQYNRIEYLNLDNCSLIAKPEQIIKKSETSIFDVRKSFDTKTYGYDELLIDGELIKTLHQPHQHHQHKNEIVLECIYTLLIKTYTLQILCLANNNLYLLNELELKILESSFANNFTLLSLDLSSNKLRQKIVHLVHGIKNCGSLRYLNISNNQIEDDQDYMLKLSEILTNPSLEYIDLSKNSIHGATFYHIKNVLQLQHKQFPQLNLGSLQLTADDLISVSEIIRESFSIRKLELQDNPSIDYSNNILQYGSFVNSLSINRLRLRQDVFKNLLNVIHGNFKQLQIVELSNTLLMDDQLTGFLQALQQVHGLKALLMDNQYFENEGVIKALGKIVLLKRLKSLSIRKSLLTYEFFEFLRLLLNQAKKLKDLDLSDNKSNDYKQKCTIPHSSFQALCDGLSQNFSLKSLNISKLQLDDDRMELLMQSLTINSTITDLDISENNITQKTYIKFIKYFRKKPSFLKMLKCQQMRAEYPIYLMQSKCFIHLQCLDISKNSQKNRSLGQIIKCCLPGNIFQHLTFINLEECNLSDHHCQILSSLMNTDLRELHLGSNQITCTGFSLLFNPILQGTSNLRALDVSKNRINDDYFTELEDRDFVQSTTLKLLAIDRNLLFGRGCQGIIKLLKSNPQLYIFNHWVNIVNELAYLTVESYINFTQDYNIKNELPNYIRELRITGTDFSDDFIIWFGQNYFRLQYLQFINFSDSSRLCTSMGKMHMYINMINNQTNYNLLEVKFDEVEQQTLTLFDDGLIRYYLMKQKLKFQNQKLMQSSYGINDSTFEKVKWGFIGKFIIHIINKLLLLFQGPLREFRMSSKLQQNLRKKMNRIKVHYVLGCFVDPITFFISMITGMMAQTNLTPDKISSNSNCKNHYCFVNDVQMLMQILLLLNLTITFICCFTCLITSIKLRYHSEPDYCILTSDQMKELLRKWPSKQEICLFLMQYLLQCKYIFDVLMITSCQDYVYFILNNEYSHLTNYENNFRACGNIMTIVICLKFLINWYPDVRCTIDFFKHQNCDPSFLLSNLWMKFIYGQNILGESVVSNYCPQHGVKVCGRLFNVKQLYETAQVFILEFPIFFLYLFFFINYQQFYFNLGYNTVFTVTGIIIFIGMVRNMIKILYNAYWALVSRPPIVKWFDINEGLLLRRYQQLQEYRIKGLNMQTVTSYQKKQQKDNNQKHLVKKKATDHPITHEQKTKSERIIQKKKTSRRQSSEYDEEGDLMTEKKHLATEQPLFTVFNSKMKIE